jgi:hypothetical protein
MTRLTSLGLTAILVAAVEAIPLADTLVLRDGRRIDGTLVSVRGDTIEFEGRGWRDGGVRRYDRNDVRTIQFDGERDRFSDRNDTRPRAGLRERVVTVDARTAWTDSGVDVRSGQDLSFDAAGEVRWGPNRRDGADGEHNSPRNNGRPMPDRNAAALIGKIGPNGDPFFIGSDRGPIRVRGGGRLFLGINDDYLLDNSGSLRVTIAY